jgi:hypothetical protein
MDMRLAILALVLGLVLSVSIRHSAQAGRSGKTSGTVPPVPAYLAML